MRINMRKKISLLIVTFFAFQEDCYGDFGDDFFYKNLKKKYFIKNREKSINRHQEKIDKKEVSCSLFEAKDDRLDLSWNIDVEDLSLLQGSSITSLNISGCQNIRDLRPLKGLSIRELYMSSCEGVGDFNFLKGMPLQVLDLSNTNIEDLTPLKGMPLKTLYLRNCPNIRDLRPLEDLPLMAIYLNSSSNIRDLTPLENKSFTLFDTYNSQCFGVKNENRSTFHQQPKNPTRQRPTILQRFSSKLEREG